MALFKCGQGLQRLALGGRVREAHLIFLKLRQPCSTTSGSEDVSPTSTDDYKASRLKSLAGLNLYPHKYEVSTSLNDIRLRYEGLANGTASQDYHQVAGMVQSVRDSGKKLKFVDIWSDGTQLQLKLNAGRFMDPTTFKLVASNIRRGDRIGVGGNPIRTKTGELSIDCDQLVLLAPCLRIIPSKSSSLESHHKRFKKRYLDLLINQSSREALIKRSKIIRAVRRFLEDRDFVELETPVLGGTVGGAAAQPFITYHNEMKANLYLRIAPELYLKQLVIGGFDRVYEIGKLFRNEGVDPTHNPEFTSCEFYQAYADYRDLMTTTRQLLSFVIEESGCDPKTSFGTSLNFCSETEYPCLEFIPSLESASGKAFPPPEHLESEDGLKFLIDLAKENGVACSPPITTPRLLDKLASRWLEPEMVQPTFLTHHPLIMSPLAKPCRDNPHLAERFELYANGMELCNAYTELNDPEMQRAALTKQAGLSDPEAMLPDEDFCTALEYGLPPTAGWGCGLDRLAAVLTNRWNIRETIPFPLMKSNL